VLDEDDQVIDAGESADDADAVVDESGEAESPPEPRRRTTPQAGTAAERAAARRARMREQGDDGKEQR
jgi:hypothetical protein